MTSYTFNFTGAAQSWTVPAGVTAVMLDAYGASGGGAAKGGHAHGLLSVTPGEVLQVNVGGQGSSTAGSDGYCPGGWNGGGRGFFWTGGGGASDVRQGGTGLSNRVIVGGGAGGGGVGGGGGYIGGGWYGGGGPNNTGGRYNGDGGFYVPYQGPGGGSQTAGGTPGTYGGTAGTSGQGGDGKNDSSNQAQGYNVYGGGGGGGGWYGGGGGGSNPQGTLGDANGAGGSGYVGGVPSMSLMESGVQTGNGQVIITLLTPNVPTLLMPDVNTTLLGWTTQRFSWAFSSSVAGDTQSAFDMRLRQIGTSAWETFSGATPNGYVDVPAGTLITPGNWEWQVRTYEAVGVVGPWSGSGFFTVASPTPGPVITSPINNSTVTTPTVTVTWSAPSQSQYEVRRLGDDGSGHALTGLVYWTSGNVSDSTTRSLVVDLPTNLVREHLQVRVFDQGLWSPYSDVMVQIEFTRPPLAAVTVTTDDSAGTQTLGISIPTPTGAQPTPVSMDIFRAEGAGAPLERIAAGLPLASSFTYRAAASGLDYSYMVRVFGANGTSSDSAATSVVVVLPDPTPLPGGGTVTPTYYGGYQSGYGLPGTGGSSAPTTYSNTAYDTLVLSDNPVAYWAPTASQAKDLTAGGRDATVVGSLTEAAMPGTGGDKAVVFDGTAKYLQIGDADVLSVPTTGILTIEAWMRPDVAEFTASEGTGYVHWLGKGESGQQEYVGRMYSQTNSEVPPRPHRISGYAFNLSGGLGTGSYFQDNVTPGTWVHYTLVINTVNTSTAYPHGYTKVYRDGVQRDQDDLFATAAVVPANGTAPLRIGTRDLASFFQGAIGKIAVYNYEVPQSRLLAHARALVPPPGAGTGNFLRTVGALAVSTAGTTSLVIPVTATIAAGTTLIVRVGHDYSAAGPTCADSKGNTYTRDRSAANAGTTMRSSVFSAQVTTVLGAGDTITITLPSVTSAAATVSQFSGFLTPTAIDAQNGATGTTTAPQLSAAGITTTNANDVLIAVLAVKGPDTDLFSEDSTAGLYNQTARVGTNNGGADNTNVTVNAAYRSVSVAGAYNYKPTLGTSRDWIAFLVAYKAA